MENKYHDMKAAFKETDNSNTKMLEILVVATGKSAAVIRKKLLPPSDVYLTAEEMVEIGAADYILQ
jgi:ATP-dependent protease ClpP protease subunit